MTCLILSRELDGDSALVAWIREQRTMRDMGLLTEPRWHQQSYIGTNSLNRSEASVSGNPCKKRQRPRAQNGRVLRSEKNKGTTASIKGFVGFAEPGLKNGGGFVAKYLVHGDTPFAVRHGEFPVDEGVVKTGGGGINGGSGVENFARASPVDGAETHRTGFAGREEFAVIELEGLKTLAGFADG